MTNILIVDDNKTDQKLIKEILLSSEGKYDITIAGTGVKAVKLIKEKEMHLVLLDFYLPDLNGFEVYKKIQECTGEAYLPIIFITEHPKEKIKIEGLKMGAVDYLAKPVHAGELTAKVEGSLNVKKIIDDSIWAAEKTNKGIRKLYKELEKRNEDLKKLDELKDEFISTVSHELRTPLTTMREFAAIIADEIPGKLTDDQREYIGIISSNVDRLTRLVEDLLDVSKIESGKIELRKKPTDIVSLVRDVIAVMTPEAEKNQVTLSSACSAKELKAFVDPDRIVQVFTNLVGNAIKFTPQKGTVTISLKDCEKDVECIVADTGIGIAPENMGKLFGKFQQIDREVGPGYKGTGLGLVITKNIVELHNGTIKVESEIKKGTQFIFTLPKKDTPVEN